MARAVRSPGKFEEDLNIVAVRQNQTVPPGITLPITLRALSSNDFDSEELNA